ncbi:hypothetical protein Tco_1302051 [Tanacetum coccineum]
MTRSSNKDLIQPFENPERVFRSLRRLSKTRSLKYLSSSEFNFISDLEDQFKKEETNTIGELTMEEYMTKTRDGYGSDIQEEILFYKGLEVPTRQILNFKGAIPTMTATNARIAIQEMAEHS